MKKTSRFLLAVYRRVLRKIFDLKLKADLAVKYTELKQNPNIQMYDKVRIFPETRINLCTKGKITIGARSFVRGCLEIQRLDGNISVGEDCYIGDGTRIWSASSIDIGNRVLIAHNCNIFDNTTHPLSFEERREDAIDILWRGERNNYATLYSEPVKICDDAWISCNCTILKGVTIGEGAIVAAGSVVTKDVAPFCVVGGNPAHFLKEIKRDENRSCVIKGE